MMNSEEYRTSCPGFLDENGVWNNGFECPPLSNQIRACCGSDSRRYCCTLDNFRTSSLSPLNRHEIFSSSSPIESSFSFIEKIHSTLFTFPTLLIGILVLIILLLSIFITLFLCCYYRKRNKKFEHERSLAKQTLLVNHFPFTPPHHQLIFNENLPQTSLVHRQAKDTLTTSTSSSSARIPSDIYFNDWKEFFNTTEQAMNAYPTMSSDSNEMTNEHLYLHSNYLFHDKHHQDDIIV